MTITRPRTGIWIALLVWVCVLALACPPLAAQSATYSLSTGFSLEKNPNGVWQYGYSLANSLAPDQFQLDKFADTTDSVGF